MSKMRNRKEEGENDEETNLQEDVTKKLTYDLRLSSKGLRKDPASESGLKQSPSLSELRVQSYLLIGTSALRELGTGEWSAISQYLNIVTIWSASCQRLSERRIIILHIWSASCQLSERRIIILHTLLSMDYSLVTGNAYRH